MKVLSIGNSFSQDAHNMLNTLAKANGVDIYTANLDKSLTEKIIKTVKTALQ